MTKPCPCGSGLPRHENCDARGIFLTFTCDKCHDRKMKGFRPDVLTDPNYPTEEPVEPDDGHGMTAELSPLGFPKIRVW